MTSPAQRHMMRVTAARVSARADADNPLQNATGYELMLARVAADRRRLRTVQSIEARRKLKAELLPDYLPWVDGVLAAGKGAQDDAFMTVMIWAIDAADFALALRMACYAIRHRLTLPDQYQRTTATLVAEEVADLMLKTQEAGAPIDLPHAITAYHLTEGEDMPDEVRAKLLKVIGYGHRAQGEIDPALNALRRALALHDKVGVKKDIERLEREQKNLAAGKTGD